MIPGQRASPDLPAVVGALQLAVEHAPAAIAIVDLQMRYVAVSRRFAADLRLAAHDLVGRSHGELFPEIPDRWREIHRRCLAGAVERCQSDPFHRADGTVDWVSWEVRPWHDAGGAIGGMVMFSEVVTARVDERRLTEGALREAESRLAAVFRVAPVPIAVLRWGDRRYVEINAAFSAVFEWSREEVLGKTPDDLGIYVDLNARERASARLAKEGSLSATEIHMRRKSGQRLICVATVGFAELGGERCAIGFFQDVTESKRTEEALAEAEEQQRLALSAAELGIWRHDVVARRMHFDERAMAHLGLDRADLTTEEFIERLHPDERVNVLRSMQQLHDGQGAGRRAVEHRVVLPSGEVRWLLVNVHVRFEGEGAGRKPVASVVTSRDITEAKRAEQRQRDTEEQLRAVQKMEAIGRLAGGVAHDFNNLLSVILSYAEAVMADLPPPNALRGDLEQVIRAAKRAEGLTSQLLSFSRHQVWRPQSVDLSVLLQNTSKMLRRLIGENIELDVTFEENLFRTRADPGQLEQVLMNLAVNARDAMPDGGRLAIRTANANVDPTRAALLQVEPGDFVELTVSDTGCGMDPETLRRIFEPFFTTKGIGKGTGLGLSTVYGIVRQSGGNIIAESAPGAGACFRIYLKREEGGAEPVRDGASEPRHGSGCETVLVVEDEEALRTVVDRVLSRAGYRVLATANAAEALALCQTRGPEVNLVLTDVIMPGMNGRKLAELIRPLCPSAKVLFMSGYTDDAIERLDVLGHDLVRKPFSRETLMQKVRAALDSAQAA
jgi:two-component system, cell cycle sensor histidine kinase and response regulator CckA